MQTTNYFLIDFLIFKKPNSKLKPKKATEGYKFNLLA